MAYKYTAGEKPYNHFRDKCTNSAVAYAMHIPNLISTTYK